MRPDRETQPGLTLIELLVVIAIIAVLLAVLLPSLSGVRAAGRSAVCLSQQRQLGLALAGYATEHEGGLVEYATPAAGGVTWWFGYEPGGPGSGQNRPLEPDLSPLAPYLGGTVMEGLACPDFPWGDPRYYPKFSYSSAHFGYNGGLDWPFPPSHAAQTLDAVRRLDATFAFADAVHMDGLVKDANGKPRFYEPHLVSHRRPGKLTGMAHFRHAARANVVYLDGHAAARPTATGQTFDLIADDPVGNLDDNDGPGTIYGFDTWTK